MGSAHMRHFTILIGNETQGPLTEDALIAMIADGSVGADTPCAPEGSTEWVPLSDYFNFGSKLKVKQGKQLSTEAEQEAATTRINPDLRKKLLVYGLADAATVDGFTQTQATVAVSTKEATLRTQLRRHSTAKATSFLLAVPLAIFAGFLIPPFPAALGMLAATRIFETGSAKTELMSCRQSIKQMRLSVQNIEAVEFEKPRGGIPFESAMANRLVILPESSFALNAQFGQSRINDDVTKAGGRLGQDRLVRLLKEIPSGRTLELLRASEQSLLHPLAGPQNWANFRATDGPELEKLIMGATLRTAPIGKDNTFTFEMIEPINSSMSSMVVIQLSINGQKAFASWGANCFDQTDWRAEPLPSAFFLARERYIVKTKVTVGGKALAASVTTRYHKFNVTRVSPTWRYLGVARMGDKDTIYLLVDEKRFASAQINEVVDQSKMATAQCFTEPVESPTPPRLEAL